MKTAEEWLNDCYEMCDDDGVCDKVINLDTIKQIQLDAMKEGMRRAAEIVNQETAQWRVGSTGDSLTIEIEMACNKAILTAAEQLNEKDL